MKTRHWLVAAALCALQLAPLPAAAGTLGGTAWMMELPKGSSCEIPPDIAFNKDGTISGNAGCNDFKGGWREGDGTLSIAYEPVTNRGCGNALLVTERTFTAALKTTAKFLLEDKALVLLDAAGKPLLRLVPFAAGACE